MGERVSQVMTPVDTTKVDQRATQVTLVVSTNAIAETTKGEGPGWVQVDHWFDFDEV